MNISLLHIYRVTYLYQNCIDSVVLISSNVMWNFRNEVDKTSVENLRKFIFEKIWVRNMKVT